MAAYRLLAEIIHPYLRSTRDERAERTVQREYEIAHTLGRYWTHIYLSPDPATNGLTGETVRLYRESRARDGVRPETIKRELALVSAAINYAITERDLDIPNPVRGRMMSRADRRARPPRDVPALSPAQERALLNAASPLAAGIITMALHTGMRLSEILLLRWDQLGDDDHAVVFQPADHKSRRHAVIAVNATARAVLEERRKGVRHLVYVFHRDGRLVDRSNFYNRIWKPARLKAGLSFTRFHALRAICGQRMLDQGASLDQVAGQLRHVDVRTTQKSYVESPLHRMRSAVELIG